MSQPPHPSSVIDQHRRGYWIVAIAIAVCVHLTSTEATAQEFPAKTVRLVVPSGAGGPADIIGRLVAERLTNRWNQPVIVENKPGGALMVGADAVAKSQPDGYTLLLTPDGPITINPAMYKNMAYDPSVDLVPVARLVFFPLVLVVNPSLPVKSASELVAYARANPGKLNYGAGGSTSRIAAELFKLTTSTDIVHIPYKGSGPLLNGLIGNETQLAFDGIVSSINQVKAGRLRALAVTSTHRITALPDLPTLDEAGVKGYESGTWLGVFAPNGIPIQIRQKLAADFADILAQPDLRKRLTELGVTIPGGSVEDFTNTIRRETEKWAQVIKRADIRPED